LLGAAQGGTDDYRCRVQDRSGPGRCYFFLFVIWIYLLIVVFSDIFHQRRSRQLGEALWVIFVIVLPYLGVFVYLIAGPQVE
jgi:hypothetical protein